MGLIVALAALGAPIPNPWAQLMFLVSLGAAVYLALLALFARSHLQSLFALVRPRRRVAAAAR